MNENLARAMLALLHETTEDQFRDAQIAEQDDAVEPEPWLSAAEAEEMLIKIIRGE